MSEEGRVESDSLKPTLIRLKGDLSRGCQLGLQVMEGAERGEVPVVPFLVKPAIHLSTSFLFPLIVASIIRRQTTQRTIIISTTPLPSAPKDLATKAQADCASASALHLQPAAVRSDPRRIAQHNALRIQPPIARRIFPSPVESLFLPPSGHLFVIRASWQTASTFAPSSSIRHPIRSLSIVLGLSHRASTAASTLEACRLEIISGTNSAKEKKKE
ncbi:hypothetical protein EDD36DRAFT_34536 [Exophiala viscosa]|uniref:Uncharacterized protein n=1 Tax=Exophiala viscosa TaxID=2486360 RepID=A0AAN6E5M5_9EURO|nr:hypothetical protein EDD36DRAFT_34536 [Exophiala viscosa]